MSKKADKKLYDIVNKPSTSLIKLCAQTKLYNNEFMQHFLM